MCYRAAVADDDVNESGLLADSCQGMQTIYTECTIHVGMLCRGEYMRWN